MDADFPVGMMECIEKFLAEDSKRPAGLDVYPEVFSTSLFFPLQRMRETEKMIRRARQVNPRVIYEIGADKGGGLYHWCKCFPSVERVIACEIRGLPYAHLFEDAFPRIEFSWIEGNSLSKKNLNYLYRGLSSDDGCGSEIDVLFIDGDKTSFMEDFWACYPFLSGDSVVFMHDITEPPMMDVFSALGNRFKTETIVDTSEVADLRNGSKQRELTPYQNWLLQWNGRSCGVGVIDTGTK